MGKSKESFLQNSFGDCASATPCPRWLLIHSANEHNLSKAYLANMSLCEMNACNMPLPSYLLQQ